MRLSDDSEPKWFRGLFFYAHFETDYTGGNRYANDGQA